MSKPKLCDLEDFLIWCLDNHLVSSTGMSTQTITIKYNKEVLEQ